MYKTHLSKNLSIRTGVLLICFLLSFCYHISITYGDRPNAKELTANIDVVHDKLNEFTDINIPKGLFRLIRATSTADLKEMNELLDLSTFIIDLSVSTTERANMSEEELVAYLETKKVEIEDKMNYLDNLEVSTKINRALSIYTLLLASVFYLMLPKPKRMRSK